MEWGRRLGGKAIQGLVVHPSFSSSSRPPSRRRRMNFESVWICRLVCCHEWRARAVATTSATLLEDSAPMMRWWSVPPDLNTHATVDVQAAEPSV